jgi:hypothetical protein
LAARVTSNKVKQSRFARWFRRRNSEQWKALAEMPQQQGKSQRGLHVASFLDHVALRQLRLPAYYYGSNVFSYPRLSDIPLQTTSVRSIYPRCFAWFQSPSSTHCQVDFAFTLNSLFKLYRLQLIVTWVTFTFLSSRIFVGMKYLYKS